MRPFMPLQASPTKLLGHFAPSGFALCARILLASLTRFSQSQKFSKKSMSQSAQNALKRIEMQTKNFTPLTHYPLHM